MDFTILPPFMDLTPRLPEFPIPPTPLSSRPEFLDFNAVKQMEFGNYLASIPQPKIQLPQVPVGYNLSAEYLAKKEALRNGLAVLENKSQSSLDTTGDFLNEMLTFKPKVSTSWAIPTWQSRTLYLSQDPTDEQGIKQGQYAFETYQNLLTDLWKMPKPAREMAVMISQLQLRPDPAPVLYALFRATKFLPYPNHEIRMQILDVLARSPRLNYDQRFDVQLELNRSRMEAFHHRGMQ